MWPNSLRLLESASAPASEHLAADAALLSNVEADCSAAGLRIWELEQYVVIAGKSNDLTREVDLAACAADGVPVLRRSSGGGTVVLGPGCLCFSLALPVPAEFGSHGISGVTAALMQKLAEAWADASRPVAVAGISDLTLADRKFSGNSQRWKKSAFLHHGTVLYDFDLPRITRYLRHPSREPDYRRGRPHAEFVTNLPLSRHDLTTALKSSWNVS